MYDPVNRLPLMKPDYAKHYPASTKPVIQMDDWPIIFVSLKLKRIGFEWGDKMAKVTRKAKICKKYKKVT